MHVQQYFSETYQIAMQISDDGQRLYETIEEMVEILCVVRNQGGRVFCLGVGGSAANSSHVVNDLRKICEIEAYALTDNVAELTAWTNDFGWKTSLAGVLRVSRLSERDAIFVFSVGGGDLERNISPNLVHAIDEAKRCGAKVIGVAGRQGGYLKRVGDAVLVIPTVNPAHVTPHTEAFHMVVSHCLVSHPRLQLASTTWERVIEEEGKITNIDAVCFDLEGTVVDVELAHHEGHRAAARDVGLELSVDDCFRDIPHFIGGPDEEIAKEIAAMTSGEDWRHILERMLFHYNRILETGAVEIKPRPGFIDVYHWLKDRGIKLTVGTLTPGNQARALFLRSGLDKLFSPECVVLKEDVANHKPAPDVFLETARRVGVHPSRQLVFEDSPRGIKAAVDAGSIAIGMPVYSRPEAIVPLYQAGAKRVFLQWNEIKLESLLANLS